MTDGFRKAVAELKATLLSAIAPLARPILDLIVRIVTREELVEAYCPGEEVWACCVRGIFDRTLRCSGCGSPVPSSTHVTRRLKR